MNQRFGPAPAVQSVLYGGGQMGEAMRALDGSQTPLGPLEHWPLSLRSPLGICLGSSFPIGIYWGPQLALLYNDAWSPILGGKHPWALGRPAREVWPEIWDTIGPMFEQVFATGEATRSHDQLLPMRRHGFTEECWFDYTFSPIRGEDGKVEGIFNAVIETTFRHIGERRTRLLRDLGEQVANAQSAAEACTRAARALAADPEDVPFCLLYLYEGGEARLAASVGIDVGTPASPARGAAGQDAGWPLAQALDSSGGLVVEALSRRFGFPLPGGPWPEPSERALAVPFTSNAAARPAGVLVAGLSPRLALDSEYRAFVERAGASIGAAIAGARAIEQERSRAQALAELDRAKTLFFSNVSHELRTPLTLMLGPIADLLAQPADAPRAGDRELLGLAQRNGQRLLRLVNTLLEFSRIEAGRAQARYEPVDLARHTAELASVFRSALENAGLGLVIDCPPLDEPVHVDRGMWEKIVLNLVSNAFKFTFEGEVRVSLARHGGDALLTVADTGTGIAAEALPRLFERFYRVPGARGRSIEGSGIGLAMVQELARLHGGSVAVTSREGQGSRFEVRVPFGSAHLPADRLVAPGAAPSVAPGVSLDAEAWLPGAAPELRETGWGGVEAGAPGLADAGPQDAPDDGRPLVLLADDNADMRAYIARLLAAEHRVLTVADGSAALALARERRPALLISDVMMPGLDGFALLRAVRADAALSPMAVILLSARAGSEARIEGLDAGADDYLVKPFNARELLARVDGSLALARLRGAAVERERALRAETQNVLESITEGFMAMDAEWRFTHVNRAAERMVAMSREAMLGRSLWALFPSLAGSVFEAPYRRAMDGRVALRVEGPYEPLGGWFEVNAYPVEGGGLALYLRDVRENRRMQAALREREQAFRVLADSMPQIVYVCDASGGSEFINSQWQAYTGRPGVTREELAEVIHPDDLGELQRRWAEAMAACRPLAAEFRLRGHDGGYRWFLTRALPSRDTDGRVVRWYGTSTDVDALKHAEAALRASEQRFRRLADALPHMVFAAAPDGAMRWINRFALDYLGVPAEAVLGQARYALLHPDDREPVRARWRAALERGDAYEGQSRMRRADGSYRWVLTRALPVRDAEGRLVEWVGGSVDIDELRLAQQALQEADRRKDEFLATLAHELRNPLAPLRNSVHVLRLSPGADTAARLEPMMRRQIDHLVRLVDDLLEVSRIGGGKIELQRAPVRLSAVLASAVETSRPLLEAGRHTLVQDLGGEELLLDADAVRLAQVFANLLNNAAKYTDAGGRIELRAARDGAQAVVSVSDTGTGIAPEMLPRLFQLFMQIDRSAARAQGGLGIGLALVRNLVRMHGGSVEAASEGLGRGSRFTVRLPLPSGTVAEAGQAGAVAEAAALPVQRRVLVVDDNRDAADSLGVLLEYLGASVRTVHDGAAALAALAGHRPHVVLLDIGMPGMDGYEVARRLRAMPQGRELTLIALTGWGQAEDRRRSRESGFDHHLVKPADIDELRRLLERAGRKPLPGQAG